MNWVEGDTVLVTGAGSGLGRALVERFLAEGAQVGALELSPAKAEALRAAFPQIAVAVGDVRSMEDNLAAVKATVDRFGKLDIFIGNAGIFDTPSPLLDLPIELLSDAFDEVMGINVKGYILGARAAIPELLKTNGSILFTASSASFTPGGGGIFYTASKHAVVGLVRQLAYELAPKVRVNAVAPGPMRSDMRGSRVLGEQDRAEPDSETWATIRKLFPLDCIEPEQYAGMFVALASRQGAATTTGVVLNAADGIAVRGHFAVSGGAAG